MHKTRAAQYGVAKIPSEPYVLPYRWKTAEIERLPESELSAWYDNMNEGVAVGRQNIRLVYTIAGKKSVFRLSPKTILQPDGSLRIVGDLEHDGIERAKRFVIRTLQSQITHPDAILLDFKRTGRKVVKDAVNAQFEALLELGVERHGAFEHILGKIRHRTYGQASSVKVSLDNIVLTADGGLSPEMSDTVGITGKQEGDVFCEYHTHRPANNRYSSHGDILLMASDRQSSIIIGTKQDDDSFIVTEWKLKDGIDVKSLVKDMSGSVGEHAGWLRGDGMKEIVDGAFDKKEYYLSRKGGRMVFQELLQPPQKPRKPALWLPE